MKGLQVLFLALCLIAIIEFGLANSCDNQMEGGSSVYCTTFEKKQGRYMHFKKCAYIRDILAKYTKQQQLTEREEQIRISSRRDNITKVVCCEDLINKSGLELLKKNEATCGEFEVEKVVGGYEIEMGSRPWMALLKYIDTAKNKTSFLCVATLITPSFLLTAAHCVQSSLISARLGEHKISTEKDCEAFGDEVFCLPAYQDIPINKTIVHKDFNKLKLVYDIALLRLKEPAQITTYVKPICLPLYEDVQRSIQMRSVHKVTGWGINDFGEQSDVPNEASISCLPLSKCLSGREGPLLGNQMCFSAFGTDSCVGDSGGPLSFPYAYQGAQRFVQVGIVNYGPINCGLGKTSVYTNVTSFLPWITQNIER